MDEFFGERTYDFNYNTIERQMRLSFPLSYYDSCVGVVGRGIRHIIESFAEPFIFIGEKIGILYVMIREIRGK